jgi:hypothetical protein
LDDHGAEIDLAVIRKKIDHPSILKIFDYFEDEVNHYVVSEVGEKMVNMEKWIVEKGGFGESEA